MDHPPKVFALGPPHAALAIIDNSNRHLGRYFCGPDLISLRLLEIQKSSLYLSKERHANCFWKVMSLHR